MVKLILIVNKHITTILRERLCQQADNRKSLSTYLRNWLRIKNSPISLNIQSNSIKLPTKCV